MRATLHSIYRRLLAAYGPQHWWPARSRTEIVVGAVLTQNTAWANVERAIGNLRRAGCLCFRRLRDLRRERLEALIRPSGTYRVKAARLKALVDVLFHEHGGSLGKLLSGNLEQARARLNAISGIGPETADAILLYAGGRPTFVVDTYTRRILRRHHLIPPPDGPTRTARGDPATQRGSAAQRRARTIGYEAVRQMFQGALRPDAKLYNEYHALLVQVGKRHCRSQARCDGCPLAELPHDATR